MELGNSKMHRFILRLTVVILTFVVGVATDTVWFMLGQPSDKEGPSKSSSASATIEKRTYDDTVIGHGVTDDGLPMGRGGITSSDGMNFSWQRITYESPEDAKDELQRKLNEAAEIIKSEPNLDHKGWQVGEKAMATFPVAKASSGVFAKILWTNGSDFGYLESSSLENLLKYEKDHGH